MRNLYVPAIPDFKGPVNSWFDPSLPPKCNEVSNSHVYGTGLILGT
jgi:hypothetical protein